MADIWLGLLSGVFFGFVIQRVGATNPGVMARAHLMLDGSIPRFMLLAVVLSAIGLWGLESAGVGRTVIHPTSLVATGLGGALFGIGWGLTGYCPGTCWAAAGEGRMDAIFAFLGGLAGAGTFAHWHESLIPALYMPTNQGQLTLDGWLGSSPLAVGVLAVGLGAGIWIVGRVWGDGEEAEATEQ
ncbi:YeeE/YedE thiosulfate transporter family protein [Desulfovermiculus halophilus]|jgi:hypothetical protein|uniref:YeeE/YedE thiosulfate transporter family protein n=1 Tax=Desulfovermiculus halophilus TaxID=339722 RepID=UPI00048117DA|nr:YeeE/YedE thiosulfate transporter family protein [Desulfovermiculus halophilus]